MKELIRCDVTFLLLVISVELLVGASVGVVRPLDLPAAPMLNILNMYNSPLCYKYSICLSAVPTSSAGCWLCLISSTAASFTSVMAELALLRMSATRSSADLQSRVTSCKHYLSILLKAVKLLLCEIS